MMGSCIEESVYVKGLCQILVHHPAVDVDEIGIDVVPKHAEFSSVLTSLVTIRFKAEEVIKDKLCKATAAFGSRELFAADQLRGLDAEKANSHFWKFDSESELDRHVNRVAVRYLRDFYQMVLRSRPMFQFIGTVSVKSARSSGHRRSIHGV